MEKRFMLFLVAVGFIISTMVGCGGGGDGGGGSSSPPTPSEPAYRIEHEGEILQVPSAIEGKTMQVIIKDKAFHVVPGMLVRVTYNEFWAGELGNKIRIQDLVTDAQGLCLFQIPRYDSQGDRTATISLPSEPEIEAVAMTIRYVIDANLPTRVMIADPDQAEISLLLGESVQVAFVVLNAWETPLSGVETQIIVGQEYTANDFAVTNENGRASFPFVAGEASGSTVFRIQVVDYPLLMAEVIISWSGGTASSVEMVSPSRWEGSQPVAQVSVGVPADIFFIVKDKGGDVVSGVMVMFSFPASASDTSGKDGIVSVIIPASQFPGFDLDKVWVIGQQDVFLDFKIEYL